MFEQEQRPQQQISREAAERYAIMVAITARKAGAQAGTPATTSRRRAG